MSRRWAREHAAESAVLSETSRPEGGRDGYDDILHVSRRSPSYAEAAAFVRLNFWFNGVDYWDGERWVLDVRGEVFLPGGPAQKRRLRELVTDLAHAESVLRRAVLLLGREDLAGDARGVGHRLEEAADVVGDAVVRLRATVGPPSG